MIDQTFISEVAAGTPTPGGGGASAYCGALGSALLSMVGNLTTGKKKYAEVESEVVAHLRQLEEVRQELLELVEKDALAFAPLADYGNRSAISDVATGVSFAQGALQGAALNVYVNAAMLDDRDMAARYTDEADRLIAESGRRADEIYNYVLEEIR